MRRLHSVVVLFTLIFILSHSYIQTFNASFHTIYLQVCDGKDSKGVLSCKRTYFFEPSTKDDKGMMVVNIDPSQIISRPPTNNLIINNSLDTKENPKVLES